MDSSAMPFDFMLFLRQAPRSSVPSSQEDAPLYTAESFSPQDSKTLKPLIDGINFSRQFILTYQLVLITILLAFTARHWSNRLWAWQKKRRLSRTRKSRESQEKPIPITKALQGKEDVVFGTSSVGSSSSSSTLRGDTTPPQPSLEGERTERTPLLLKAQSRSQPLRQLLVSKVRAWLTYQPAPIPIINKTLPSNASSLAIVAFLGLQIFYLFFKTPLSVPMLFVSADRASLLFVANLPLLYLFAAKNQPIKFLTGYSYESLNIIHRRLGEVMCLLALLHSAGMIVVWYTLLRPSGITLAHFLLIKIVLLGIGAFVAYELIYFTSLGTFRQRWYELFLGLHVLLQVAALVLVWFHHPRSRIYVGVALGIFLVDRLAYRMAAKVSNRRFSLEIKEDGRTVVLSAPVPLTNRRSFFPSLLGADNITTGWQATEHAFLTVPSLARKHVFQAHPFTIASKAPSAEAIKPDLGFIIRAQDGFSGDLVRYAKSHDSVSVRLDGPYGSQSAVQLLQDSNYAVIVAGGSGIAVAWPLVCALLKDLEDDPEGLQASTKRGKILFVWVIRENSHVSWLGQERLMELNAAGINSYIPPPTAENGHPDIQGIITEWINSLDSSGEATEKFGVVASGPDGLNRAVRNTCAALIGEGRNVHVEIEKFGW